MKEYNELQRNPLTGCSAYIIDGEDICNWEGWIAGPEDSPYEGGIFFLKIELPKDYPLKPPEIYFWLFSCKEMKGP